MTDPLVAVDERMILNQRECECTGFFFKGRIEINVGARGTGKEQEYEHGIDVKGLPDRPRCASGEKDNAPPYSVRSRE